jgi:hypothetical protein
MVFVFHVSNIAILNRTVKRFGDFLEKFFWAIPEKQMGQRMQGLNFFLSQRGFSRDVVN